MIQPALIIIDMQRGMLEPAAGDRNNPDAPERLTALLHAWRQARAPIVHVRHISRATTTLFAAGRPSVEFQPSLYPLPDEHVVEKNVPDAFINSGLERWLRVRGIEAVVIGGVSTNNSVEGTARSAGNLGFRTYVLADACFTFAKVDYNGVLRSAEEVHAMALANLQEEYARIIDSAEAAALLQTSELPG